MGFINVQYFREIIRLNLLFNLIDLIIIDNQMLLNTVRVGDYVKHISGFFVYFSSFHHRQCFSTI